MKEKKGRERSVYEEETGGRAGEGKRGEGGGRSKRRGVGGYQERTSQVAARWRIIIVASSVSRIQGYSHRPDSRLLNFPIYFVFRSALASRILLASTMILNIF